MKKYNLIRNYKRFKKEYLYFVVFIKYGDYYYTYDSDAKIMMYLYNTFRDTLSFRIEKVRFKEVISLLHKNGLNVVLAGWKNADEYYTSKQNEYNKIKKKSKEIYRATQSGLLKSN